jgi:hypothetical protein
MQYALARVQAHYGRRLGEIDWRVLDASRDLSHYLDAVRAGALADWVSSLDLTQDCHAIERSLRIEWRRYVKRVAAWHPQAWQPWLAWLAWLPTLSLLAQLARAEPAPAWLMADPVCGPIAPGVPAERITKLHGASLAVFEPAISGRLAVGTLWRLHWLALIPRTDERTRELLGILSRAIGAYADQLAPASGSATAARQQLADRLTKLFRAGAGSVVATVCYLALLALDLERLRGGLTNRCLLPVRVLEAA